MMETSPLTLPLSPGGEGGERGYWGMNGYD